MNSTDIATETRYAAFIGDATQYPDYPDSRVLTEANKQMLATFTKPVVSSRQGFWMHKAFIAVTAGRANYRVPARSVTGGAELVEIADASGYYCRIGEATAEQADTYDLPSPQTGTPQVYVMYGDQIVLYPTPSVAYTLRLSIYLRPSRLVTQQSTTIGGGTVRGQVTLINTATRQITVNALPFDQELAAPAAITSGLQKIDVVHPDGWHELPLWGASQTISGLIFTIGGTLDMSEIELGDFVRVSEQTDWPQLPDEFHSTLCSAAAVQIMMQLNMAAKAGILVQSMAADLDRFKSLINPRVKAEPRLIKPSWNLYGGRGRSRLIYP